MLSKALKLAQLATVPAFVRGLWHGVSATIEHRKTLALLEGKEVRTVVDVGANKGQFALLARYLFPNAMIHAFEPLEGPAETLENIFANDPRMKLHRCAIGAAQTNATIHISRREDSSSLLPIGKLQVDNFPNTQEAGQKEVPVSRLDLVLSADDIVPQALMKIDVQGYEGQVIEGAAGLLERFRFVYCEVSFLPLYEGQELAPDIIRRLATHGFGLRAVNVSSNVQTDLLFERDLAYSVR